MVQIRSTVSNPLRGIERLEYESESALKMHSIVQYLSKYRYFGLGHLLSKRTHARIYFIALFQFCEV